MGATYCCSQDERKNSFKAYINNLHLTGIDGMGDLGSADCPVEFKNQYEKNFKLTKESLVLFYDELMRKFAKVRQPSDAHHALAKVNVKVINEYAGLLSVTPCVL